MILVGIGANKPFAGRCARENVARAGDAVMALGQGGAMSGIIRSPAWPDPSDPPYANAVVRLARSSLDPAAFLAALHGIEDGFGRERAYLADPALRYAPRTMDLDLLDYDGLIRAADPVLPHPGIESRTFVLGPVAEVAPDWRHPVTGQRAIDTLGTLTQ